MAKEPLYLGIDNGKYGGFCVIDSHNTVQDVFTMPLFGEGEKQEYDIPLISGIFTKFRDSLKLVTLEKVFCMPTIPRATAQSLGWCLGLFEGMCNAFGLSYVVANPQTWQKRLFAGMSYDDTKTASVAYAKRLQPNFDWALGDKKPKDGLTDAYCLAVYGKTSLIGI